ncbi:MAG: DNA polymerase III subunit gamma/tau [Candidatus Acidiferrum sp.]
MSNYQVIARKWRPQTFRDLVGQEHVTETLKNAIEKDRVAHAYIFSGARGVGKTTAARILAKALNCVNGPTANPCGVCAACQEIASGNSLDVIEIDAASNRGIDQIRELREMVRYAPAASRHKVVILDEAHMLTTEASNALLKTLEEPPDRVIFVMATTEPENLEDTIRSRSQHFHFRALTFAEISKRLEHIAAEEKLIVEPGALAVIARMAEGSLRDALSLLEQARAYCGDTIPDKEVRELLGVVPEDALEELVNAVAEGSADRALGLVHRFQKDGRNLQHFCREAIRHIRNLLIARVCGADSELIAATADQRPALARAAALFGEEDLTRFFQILLQTDDSLRRAPDPRVHLEMGLLRLINAARLAPLEELLAEMRGGSSGGAPSSGASRGAVAGSATPASKKIFAESAATATRGDSAIPGGSSLDAPAPRGPEIPPASGKAARPPQSVAFTQPPEGAASEPVRRDHEDHPLAAVATSAEGDAAQAASARAEAASELTAEGISPEQVARIKAAIQAEKKFLGELVEHSSRWQLEGAELRIFFPVEKRAFAELLEGREALEKIRAAAAEVLGQPVRVCTRIASLAAAAAAGAGGTSPGAARGASSPGSSPRGGEQAFARTPHNAASAALRARFENDPMVRAIIDRFGGKISEVKPRPAEA